MKKEDVPTLGPFDFREAFFESSAQAQALRPPSNYFYISRVESFKDAMKLPLLPHRKTVHDFMFLTRGHTARSKGLDNHAIDANTFFFLPAYQITTHDLMTADAAGFYCHFDAELLRHRFIQHDVTTEFSFMQLIGNPVVRIEPAAVAQVVGLLTSIEAEYLSAHPDRYALIQVYLLALFVIVRRYATPPEKGVQNAALRITQQYKTALAQHIGEKNLVAEYAALLAVSPNHLHKCVKAVTGKSAHDLLDEMILLEAKVLLKQSKLTISEIAYKIGEQDPSDFGRFFKAKTKLTPTEYRQLD
ncbi:MAG TPA: helix-turn-helix domain-containing protein [Hymenobacter sp.]|jgi:AraC-like DNA-binding protein